MELVADIRPREDVIAAFGYTKSTFKDKLRDESFVRLLREAKQLWSADNNVRERIRTKAGMLVEDSLLDIYNIVTDRAVNPSIRNASFQNLARVASVDSPDKNVSEGSGFRVIINLPSGEAPVELSGHILEHEAD